MLSPMIGPDAVPYEDSPGVSRDKSSKAAWLTELVRFPHHLVCSRWAALHESLAGVFTRTASETGVAGQTLHRQFDHHWVPAQHHVRHLLQVLAVFARRCPELRSLSRSHLAPRRHGTVYEYAASRAWRSLLHGSAMYGTVPLHAWTLTMI